MRRRRTNVIRTPTIDLEIPSHTSPAFPQQDQEEEPNFVVSQTTIHLAIGERQLWQFVPEIRELRHRLQQQDFTLDPEYFIAANTLNDARVAAVLIRHKHVLQGCVFFLEHCRFGLGLGLWRGGDATGDSLVVGAEKFRLQYLHIATQFLLRRWRIHSISLTVKLPIEKCIASLGPQSGNRMFCAKGTRRTLPLKDSYSAMLAAMGPRTRRSLSGKRRQLETREKIAFLPSLPPSKALEAMLALQSRCTFSRVTRFYHARYNLLHNHPQFFCMGLRLPTGTWLSMLSGWRDGPVTYVDMQMNDTLYKKESLSAVMRAFLLEHEISRKQEQIAFVGGTSVLLRRYCQPVEIFTDVLLSRPGLLATLFRKAIPHVRPGTIYERVLGKGDERAIDLVPAQ